MALTRTPQQAAFTGSNFSSTAIKVLHGGTLFRNDDAEHGRPLSQMQCGCLKTDFRGLRV